MDPSAVSAFSAYQAAKSPARKNSGQQKSKKREQSSQKNGAPPQKKSKKSKTRTTSTKNLEDSVPKNLAAKPSKTNKASLSKQNKAPRPSPPSSKTQHKAKPIQNTIVTSSTPTKSKSLPKFSISDMQCSDEGSIKVGEKLFAKLLSPMNVNTFMENHWERKSIYIKRQQPNYYDKLLGVSTEAINDMLIKNHIQYTKNIDVTSYVDGVRETHNPEGRALPDTVWNLYNDGCSIRLLNPQTFMPQLHRFNAAVQEYFHCLAGANIYLTPPNSQGFAPHYDDIEAFVLQIEGKKLWRLYNPRTPEENLPRVSSGNFNENEIGEPVLEKELQPGDIMYFPRGTIHQAKTVPGHHSLHITLSVYQKTAYADLFEELMKNTVQKAFSADIDYRRGLPLDIWHNMGVVHEADETKTERREQIKDQIKDLFEKLVDHMDIDDAVDKLAMKYQHEALPPAIGSAEKKVTSYGVERKLKNGLIQAKEIHANSTVRLLRANIVRLVIVENEYRLYYYADNSKEYQEFDPNYVELDETAVNVVRQLVSRYPKYAKVKSLAEDADDALDIVLELWGRGILMTKPVRANNA